MDQGYQMDPKDGFVLHVIVNLLYFMRARWW